MAMTRIHGNGSGSVTAEVARLAAIMLICFSLGAIGCASKKAPGTEGLNGGSQTNPDLSSRSTLEDYSKEGTIGGEGGPLSDIHFGYNDYAVQPQDSSILRSNANWLQAHPNGSVQVEGNCDERGSEDYNIALGAKRAQAAKNYLTTLGIPASRVSTITYGKELPLCQEHDESCWQRNRRDHFVVSGGQASR